MMDFHRKLTSIQLQSLSSNSDTSGTTINSNDALHQYHHKRHSHYPQLSLTNGPNCLVDSYKCELFKSHHSSHSNSFFHYPSLDEFVTFRNSSSTKTETLPTQQVDGIARPSVIQKQPCNRKTMDISSASQSSIKKKSLTMKEVERKRDLANKQERRRMHRLNDALNRLRQVCSTYFNSHKLTCYLYRLSHLNRTLEGCQR